MVKNQILYFFSLFAEIASDRRLLGFSLQDVDIYGMIYPGDLSETFLLGYSGGELKSYPSEIAGIHLQNLVQVMSVVFTERDNVVASVLHSFGVIFH